MDQTSLTFKTLKNVSYNIVGYVWPMAFALFITPIIVFKLGIKEYGIYLFINTIISLFGLLDLGLSTATLKHVSYQQGKGNHEAVRKIVRSTNSLFLIIATVGLLLSIGIAFLGPKLLPQQFSNYEIYASLFILAGATFFASTIGAPYSSILNAIQRYDVSVKLGMIFPTLSSLVMLIIVLTGGSLKEIFVGQLLVTILSSFVMYVCTKMVLPVSEYRLSWHKETIKEAYAFGLVFSINNVASAASTYLARLIIPFFAGPTNLTYFSMAGTIASKVPGISNALGTSIFPTTSQLHGEENPEKIANLYKRSIRLISIISAALVTTAIAFSYPLLTFWLDVDFANKASSILITLALANFVLALYGPLNGFLLGIGKIRFVTINSVIISILNLILLLILMPKYGILGAAYAQLISLAPVIYMFYKTEKKYLSLINRKRHHTHQILGILITSGIVWSLDRIIFVPLTNNLVKVLIFGGLSFCLYLTTFKILGFFQKEDWDDIVRFITFVTKRKISR